MATMGEAARQIEEERRAAEARARGESPQPAKSEVPAKGDNTKELRSLVDRIVRLEEEKRGIAADIKELYTAAQDAGFNRKALRVIVKREMEDSDQKAAREAIEAEVDNMLAALGDFASSPLGESAVARAR